LEKEEKSLLLKQCCGSARWIEKMLGMPPAEDLIDLFEEAEEKWYECNEEDWKEAFTHHPKIGDIASLREKFKDDHFVKNEQGSISQSSEKILQQLADANKLYEQKFGYIFIVFATGKSAEEMLNILQSRLTNLPEKEIKIAMEEQNKITQHRLTNLFL
jgi:2-oxo-4-hydroxy-4-carboxy-5-ureidoimidazoline decarboxylase